jgi:hypothetical protein
MPLSTQTDWCLLPIKVLALTHSHSRFAFSDIAYNTDCTVIQVIRRVAYFLTLLDKNTHTIKNAEILLKVSKETGLEVHIHKTK